MNQSDESTPWKTDAGRDSYAMLRRKLITSQLNAGSKMNVSEWSKQLGVNRFAVREAMVLLAHEGLLKWRNGKFFVPAPERRDIEEILQARAIVEVGAIRLLAAAGLDKESAATLEKICDVMEMALNMGMEFAVVEADRNFHRQMVVFAQNERLLDMYDRAALPLMPSQITDPAKRLAAGQEVVAEHRMLCSLVMAQRSDEAVQLLEKHLSRGIGHLFTMKKSS